MNISHEDIKRIARLAKIKIEDNELPKFQSEVNDIMDWIDKLNTIPIGDVEHKADTENLVLERNDANQTSDQHEAILSNAPQKQHNFFVVPKVVE